jgi:DNA-binding protein HU-beta
MAKGPMTKKDIVAALAQEAGISQPQAQAALESLLDACKQEVKAGRAFRLPGLGTFTLKQSKARQGVNPATGEKIKIKASKRMGFKAGSQVDALLNPKQ